MFSGPSQLYLYDRLTFKIQLHSPSCSSPQRLTLNNVKCHSSPFTHWTKHSGKSLEIKTCTAGRQCDYLFHCVNMKSLRLSCIYYLLHLKDSFQNNRNSKILLSVQSSLIHTVLFLTFFLLNKTCFKASVDLKRGPFYTRLVLLKHETLQM